MIAALRDQQRELAALVATASADELERPSRCPGWTVADVLLHLAQTDEMAVASVEGRFESLGAELAGDLPPTETVDDLAGAMVDAQRTTPTAARDRWLAAAAAQLAAFEVCDPSARVSWVAGDMAARTLASTRLAECWIHTGDVAVAFGELPAPTDRLRHIARLAWRTVPYALAGGGVAPAGPVAFDLTAPDGSRWAFGMDDEPRTVVTGAAAELCAVAGQRADAADTDLVATGPDAEAVLRLVRTFA